MGRKVIAGILLVAAVVAAATTMSDAATAAPVSHGPMIGGVAPDRVQVWLRTSVASDVFVEYGAPGALTKKTSTVATKLQSDVTAEFELTGLEPATTYEYRVVVNGVPQPTKSVRTAPPAGDTGRVDIALFADSFQGKPAPGLYEALDKDPDFAVILGDWDHKVGAKVAGRRASYRDIRSTSSKLGTAVAETLIANQVPTYAVWDDHDYCANNSSKRCASRAAAMQVWNEYHTFSADTGWPHGIWQRFEYGLVEVYILDTRSNRDPGYCAGCRTILGSRQREWLFDRLAASTAQWKVVVSPTPLNDTLPKEGDAWGSYDEERLALLGHLDQAGVTNVVFVSGDIHTGGAVDDGTYSGRPEMSVPLANQGYANTYSKGGKWSEGQAAKSTPGFGWITATANELRLETYGANGQKRIFLNVASGTDN